VLRGRRKVYWSRQDQAQLTQHRRGSSTTTITHM
jgi:hypothetical protein